MQWRAKWSTATIALAAIATAASASPAAASAATYYADPAGSGTTCSQASPCLLKYTVETKAMNNDEVVVMPGTYLLDSSDLQLNHVIDLHGVSSGQRPKISFDKTGDGVAVFSAGDGSQLRDLEIENQGSGTALNAGLITGDRLYVSSESTATPACNFTGDTVLRDSVCVNFSSGDAIGVASFGTTVTVRPVNVTAVSASGDGVRVSGNLDSSATVNATNVIASGSPTDVRVQTSGGGSPSANALLDHSNYDTTASSGGGTTITIAGAFTNQTAPPVFAPGLGNFHQAAGSPTIDRGATGPPNGGPLDFDGEARAQGPSQDIGADEFTFAPSPTPAPPSSAFSFGKLKRNKRKGIAFLLVNLPGPGEVGLRGKGLKTIGGAGVARASLVVSGGTVKLKVRPAKKGKKARKLRKRLRRTGKAGVKVKVAYIPTGGFANTQTKKLTLKMKLKRKK
jgi:hypothetical protein